MSHLTSQLLTEQFLTGPLTASPRKRPWPEYLWLALAAVAAIAVIHFCVSTNAIGAMLSATSIMTGLIFTMAMRFWERSLDAPSDREDRFDGDKRAVLDGMRNLLIWTVLAGIVSTLWLGGLAVVFGTSYVPVWATAVTAFLGLYQLLHVLEALVRLYGATFTLRD